MSSTKIQIPTASSGGAGVKNGAEHTYGCETGLRKVAPY